MEFRDLYSYVFNRFTENDYLQQDDNEKRKILDSSFKDYMQFTLCYLNSLSNVCDIDTVDVVTLYERLSSALHPEVHNKTIAYFNELLISIINYGKKKKVVWMIEEEDYYIDNPSIIEKDDLVDVLVTHKNTSHVATFKLLYDFYVNSCLKIKDNNKSLTMDITNN